MAKNSAMEAGALEASPRRLAPEDMLVLPMNRRMVTQYAVNDEGLRELRLYHEDKEISFDEPELFAFGEALARQSRFCAGASATWAEGCDWPRARDLLETLIEAGLLRRASEAELAGRPGAERSRPSPLPPAPCTRPRDWRDAEQITRDLAGRAVEQGYLELVIPIFRVAHPSLDAEGRQVGEANVFPRGLRLEVPTEWATCPYSGTRYLVDAPMNVTALKSMRDHWTQMMAALLRIRTAFLRRFPEAANGWTVGHIERLSVSVLAVPTYQLMRTEGPVANGKLHPALSSLFRVTDGLRMTMHQMLFVPIGEPTLSPDDPMTAERIYEYADRNFSFHSDTGVCGGPKNMVQEFIRVLVEGQGADRFGAVVLDPEVEAALADVDIAMDYALRGLQAYAVTFSLWPLMTRAYEQIAEAARRAVEDGAAGFAALEARMTAHVETLRQTPYLATEAWRLDREKVYGDMYARCGAGVARSRPVAELHDLIAPTRPENEAAQRGILRGLLMRRLRQGARDEGHVEALADLLWSYATRTQATLRAATATQAEINTLLGRRPPSRPFGAADMDIHNLLQGSESRRLPFLLDELAAGLDVHFDIDMHRIELGERRPAAIRS
ncbi:MAG: hypothetical protein U1E23_05155 [Reyranellaceae bacterium]